MCTNLYAVKVEVLMIVAANDSQDALSRARCHIDDTKRARRSMSAMAVPSALYLPSCFSGDDEPVNSTGEKIKNYF